MKNFKQILSKLSVIFLLFYSQNIFSMTQTEIQLEKASLAEMIDIASEIMEKNNLLILIHCNINVGISRFLLIQT